MNIKYSIYEFPTKGSANSAAELIKASRNDVSIATFTCGLLIILWVDKEIFYYKVSDYLPGPQGGL